MMVPASIDHGSEGVLGFVNVLRVLFPKIRHKYSCNRKVISACPQSGRRQDALL